MYLLHVSVPIYDGGNGTLLFRRQMHTQTSLALVLFRCNKSRYYSFSELLQKFLSIFGINGSFLKIELSEGNVSLQLTSCKEKKNLGFFLLFYL